MTEFEIAQSYRQAKDKSAQIGVLADLTQKSKEDIVKILIEMGEVSGTKNKKQLAELKAQKQIGDFKLDGMSNQNQKRIKFKWTPELVADLTRLRDEGFKKEEISERLGIDLSRVSSKLAALRKGKKNPEQVAVPEYSPELKKLGVLLGEIPILLKCFEMLNETTKSNAQHLLDIIKRHAYQCFDIVNVMEVNQSKKKSHPRKDDPTKKSS